MEPKSYSAQEDVFGGWAVSTVSPEGALSFASRPSDGTGAAQAVDVPVWRDNLPADLEQATARLAGREARLEASLKNLAAAADRLDAFAKGGAPPRAVSFAVTEGAEPTSPEATLSNLMWEIQTGGSAESFGIGDKFVEGWGDVSGQFQGFVKRLEQLVTKFAWVETDMEGQGLGQTVVGWTGDMSTVWRAGIGATQMDLHQRNLGLALNTRSATIRMFILVTQGAAKIGGLLATPGGAVLAVPAAWKFINQVLAELNQRPK